MINDERLETLANGRWLSAKSSEIEGMARELLALRKSSLCQHQWNVLKLVECGGRYQYCTLCGAKKVAG